VRIVLLVNGMTGYLHAEFEALHKLGHELLLVTPGSSEVVVGAMVDTAFGDLGTEQFATVIAWDQPLEPDDLVARVRDFDPDAVLMTSWNFAKAYRAVMKAVPARVVLVLIMDNLWRAAPRQWLGRATHRWYVDNVADAALVPSDRSEFYARRLGFGPADIIRGSISADTHLFRSPSRTAEELAGRRTFLYVGRLVDHKGADVLAHAYRRYRELVDDPWDLQVVGIGPLQPMLEELPGVTLHGFVQPPGVAELMREVSCFVLTSHIEPYGVVVHEAAASGLPILCSDFTGAVPGFIQDGYNGWVVPAGAVEHWAQAMRRMSLLPGSRLAEMSDVSRALSTRLSPEGWARNLEEELQRRASAGGGRLS
jgi:glycosyltransferase involved in cell wall biosynthesis